MTPRNPFKMRKGVLLRLAFGILIVALVGISAQKLYYRYAITGDGNITPANRADAANCVLRFGNTLDAEVVLRYASGQLYSFDVKKGVCKVFPGAAFLYSYDATIRDEEGFTWNIWYHFRHNRNNPIELKADTAHPRSITVGPPLFLFPEAHYRGDSVLTVKCRLKDQYGNAYRLRRKRLFRDRPFEFTIQRYDEQIARETFKCFCGGKLSRTFGMPSLRPGKYEARVVLPNSVPFTLVNGSAYSWVIPRTSEE